MRKTITKIMEELQELSDFLDEQMEILKSTLN